MKLFSYTSILFLTCFSAVSAYAQIDKSTVSEMVAAKKFTFVATSATPQNVQDISKIMGKMQGGSQSGFINLSGDGYDLKVSPDSIVAYLPYYGRSYSAPINQGEGGIKFTSKNFEYKSSKTKKGNWTINLEIKDANEGYRLYLNISENGYASLSLNSNNKQAITYNGYLNALEKDNK